MNDLDYKHCTYYKRAEEEEHCAFSCVCSDNCIFSLLGLREDYNELNKSYNDLEQELNMHFDNEQELDDLKTEYSDLEDKLQEYHTQCNEYILTLLKSLSKYEELPRPYSYMDELTHIHNFIDQIEEETKMWSKCTDPINVKMVAEDKYKPTYANPTDACMDLKARITVEEGCRKYTDNLSNTNYVDIPGKECWIFPGETRLLGTGLQVAVPQDHVMLVDVRSSTGAKLKIQLANTIGVIDTGYRDEVKVCLYNFGNEPVKIEDGQRLCQFFIIPRPRITPNFVQDDEQFRQGDRCGGFGSTGV